MDIKEIRRFRLRALIRSEFGGVSARFAEKIGKQPSYIARIFSGNAGHARNVGEGLARQIESICGLSSGYLDVPPTDEELMNSYSGEAMLVGRQMREDPKRKASQPGPALRLMLDEASGEMVVIQHLALAELAGGPGEMIALKLNWLKRNVTYTDVDNLWLLTHQGDGMAPTILDGDMLLVDTGHTSVDFDGIYTFGINGQLRSNRIQRELDGGLRIISDNPHYKDMVVSVENSSQVKIGARVVYAWTGRPL